LTGRSKFFLRQLAHGVKKAKQFLEANQVQYQDLNVAENKEARDEMINMTHQMAVPTIAIDGEFVIGYNEKALKEKLGIK